MSGMNASDNGSAKRGLEDSSKVQDSCKKPRIGGDDGTLTGDKFNIDGDDGTLTVDKFIIVPVATIGCGKTTVALILQYLFPDWGHVQNDNIADGRHLPNALEKECLKFLSQEADSNGIYNVNNVLIVDRNNHMFRERASLIDGLNSLKKDYFPNDGIYVDAVGKTVRYKFRFIALDFLGSVSKENLALWDTTYGRIVARGSNHQSIKLESQNDRRKVEEIMKGFINRYQSVNVEQEPDCLFDLVIRLDVFQEKCSRKNIDIILDQLKTQVPGMLARIPEPEEIDNAFKKALEYAPSITKVFSKSGGSVVYKKTVGQRVDLMRKPVQEKDVGITSFISPDQLSFVGTLKQRYTDFMVNEIGLDGAVAHLLDEGFSTKERRQEKKKTSTPEKKEEQKPVSERFNVTEEQKEKLIKLLGNDDYEQLKETVMKSRKMVTQRTFTDKALRTEFHQLLRSVFNNKLESITNDDQTIKIGIANHSTRKPNKKKYDPNDDPHGLGPKKEFLHFVMYKKNKDTMEAVNILAKFTRINPKSIRYAGTKDRRAVTVQNVCILKGDALRMNNMNKSLRGIRLGSFQYKDEGLDLGDLQGNEFLITIRDVKSLHPEKAVEDIMEVNFKTLKEKGFINYYGMQRFGTFSVSTHEIGKMILLSDWETACQLILSNQEFVLPESAQAREIWEQTRDPHITLLYMPYKCLAETCILKALCEETSRKNFDGFNANSYFLGIMKIPRNLRIMYGHAYQSYIWNAVASRRFELFGFSVVAGDLVLKEQNTKDLLDADDILEGGEDVRSDTFIRARPITEEEVKANKFTIYDVVLPSPGFDVIYPENPAIKQVYIDIMAKDGLDPFKMARNVRDFSFAGSYRHLINKPQALEYHIRHYEDPIQELVADDLDILRANQNTMKIEDDGGNSVKVEDDDGTSKKIVESIDSVSNNKDKKNQDKKEFDELKRILPEVGGSRKAVIIKMRLATSAYATMALRELMKIDTTRRSDSFNVTVVS